MRRVVLALALCTVAGLGTPAAEAASSVHRCKPIVNPYPGTRYEGADLRQIRSRRASCRSARKVVRGAHHKALGITPPPSGVRHFKWHGWRVSGDLRGDTDRYVAERSNRRVRWIF